LEPSSVWADSYLPQSITGLIAPDEPFQSWLLALRTAQSRLLARFSDECEVFNFDKGVVCLLNNILQGCKENPRFNLASG
jgi:hypothetical protein